MLDKINFMDAGAVHKSYHYEIYNTYVFRTVLFSHHIFVYSEKSFVEVHELTIFHLTKPQGLCYYLFRGMCLSMC